MASRVVFQHQPQRVAARILLAHQRQLYLRLLRRQVLRTPAQASAVLLDQCGALAEGERRRGSIAKHLGSAVFLPGRMLLQRRAQLCEYLGKGLLGRQLQVQRQGLFQQADGVSEEFIIAPCIVTPADQHAFTATDPAQQRPPRGLQQRRSAIAQTHPLLTLGSARH
ncbi:hypothetical protein D3C71_1705480 [compost metagenome]